MIRLTLSKDEILLLQKYIHSPVELIRFKAMTVLARSEEIPLESFATVLNRSECTITRWVKDYSEKGMSRSQNFQLQNLTFGFAVAIELMSDTRYNMIMTKRRRKFFTLMIFIGSVVLVLTTFASMFVYGR